MLLLLAQTKVLSSKIKQRKCKTVFTKNVKVAVSTYLINKHYNLSINFFMPKMKLNSI